MGGETLRGETFMKITQSESTVQGKIWYTNTDVPSGNIQGNISRTGVEISGPFGSMTLYQETENSLVGVGVNDMYKFVFRIRLLRSIEKKL